MTGFIFLLHPWNQGRPRGRGISRFGENVPVKTTGLTLLTLLLAGGVYEQPKGEHWVRSIPVIR